MKDACFCLRLLLCHLSFSVFFTQHNNNSLTRFLQFSQPFICHKKGGFFLFSTTKQKSCDHCFFFLWWFSGIFCNLEISFLKMEKHYLFIFENFWEFFAFFKNENISISHIYEGKKETKVAIFREQVPTSGKIIGGNLKKFLQIFGGMGGNFLYLFCSQ